MKIRKWTFINVLFSKIQNRFEKTLHHHFFSVRLPQFRRPYLYALDAVRRAICIVTIMVWVCKSAKKIQKMVQNLGKTFFRILSWTFLGDVLEKCLNDLFTFFQKMVQKLGRPFCRILGWTFLGDVLDN